MCRALEVSESGYYAWNGREPSAHEREDARIAAEIQQIFQEHRQVYGSPRIHAVLKTRGIRCGRKRVVRLMRTLGLSALPKKEAQAAECILQGKSVPVFTRKVCQEMDKHTSFSIENCTTRYSKTVPPPVVVTCSSSSSSRLCWC